MPLISDRYSCTVYITQSNTNSKPVGFTYHDLQSSICSNPAACGGCALRVTEQIKAVVAHGAVPDRRPDRDPASARGRPGSLEEMVMEHVLRTCKLMQSQRWQSLETDTEKKNESPLSSAQKPRLKLVGPH